MVFCYLKNTEHKYNIKCENELIFININFVHNISLSFNLFHLIIFKNKIFLNQN